MKLVIASLVTALLMAASCSAPPAIPLPPEKPPEDAKNIPGIMHYHRAAVAYAKYRDLVHEQKERKNPLARRADSAMPEEVIEKKKRKYLADAQENLEKMIAMNPAFPMAHQVLGLVYFERDEYGAARAQFREVLKLDPLAGNTWVNIAYTYWREGDAGKAKEAMAQALKINPDNRAAAQLRILVENEERKKAAQEEQGTVPPFRPELER